MSAASSKQRAGETPGQGLQEGPSPTRGQGARGIRAESSLKTPEPLALSGPFLPVPSLKSVQYQEAPGTLGRQPSPAQDPWLPCPLPIPHPSPLPAPNPHWRGRKPMFDPSTGKICWRRKWLPSSILDWEIPGTEEPGRLQSMGSQRVGHD